MAHSIDAQGKLVLVSDLWLSTLGYERSEVVGRFWPEFLTPASRKYAIEVVMPEGFRIGHCKDIEYQMVRKDGVLIDVLLSSFMEHDARGAALQSLTIIQDVTQRKREQSELAVQYERLRVTMDSIGDGVISTDAHGRIRYLNPVAERLTGWTNAQARGRPSHPVFNIVHEETRRRAKSPIGVCLSEDRIVGLANHTVLLGRDRREYHIEDSAAPIKDAAGRTVGAVLVFRDVSEQRQLSLEMTYRATHDELTGLLNRGEFERRLESTLITARKGQERYVLMYIDLDRFKLVNDAGGHAVGDRLLKQVAGLIKRVARRHDIFARLGGDEFGLIVEHCSMEAAQNIAQSICEEVDAFRFQHGDQFLRIGTSIGLVEIDERWPTVASLLRAADSACYAAKEAGRSRVYAYFAADEVIDSHQKDMQWARRIEHALDNRLLVLHWQEIRALDESADGIHGEVLLRMVGEEGKLVSPGAFLPSAERFHMASRIDRWVVNETFEWMATHREALEHLDTLSINLSGLSIGDRDFHRYVTGLIETIAFDHHKLCFEITETAAITNLSDATSFFELMHAFGVRFALDDFGSGLSSFGYLKNLPANYLKIDGQFIRDLETNLVGQATVRCIQEVARITGKKTVAESVETEAVEVLLRKIGIDYTQGYLRHRPEPLDTILTMRFRQMQSSGPIAVRRSL